MPTNSQITNKIDNVPSDKYVKSFIKKKGMTDFWNYKVHEFILSYINACILSFSKKKLMINLFNFQFVDSPLSITECVCSLTVGVKDSDAFSTLPTFESSNGYITQIIVYGHQSGIRG